MIEMGFEELFVRFWWLIFPLFAIAWAFAAMVQSGRRSKQAMDLIKSYVEQGKDPPAELLSIAADGYDSDGNKLGDKGQGTAATTVTFTALAVGFGLAATLFPGNEKTQSVFFILGVTFGVVALGTFFIAMFGPRPQK